ncbi:MAG: sulfatase-like hydrolase/transferase [Kiritimatiellales bacterium]|nr:sulfatase-like hydrolase/transferase [Kiritimatiellales bacterium]
MKQILLPTILGLCLSALPAAAKPNILFVYTDDQASWAMGVSGDPNARTPNMDRLASEGARFTNAFCTTPVCSPARASIMTSRYAIEFGIRDFIPMPGHKCYDPETVNGLDPKSTTFAEILQSAGYATGLVGKWHLGNWTEDPRRTFHPTRHGFDYFMGLPEGGCSPQDPELEKDGKIQKFKGLTTDILTEHAIGYIRGNGAEKPFLLCLNYRAPHGAWLPVAPEDWAPYKDMDPTLPHPDYPGLDVKKVKRMMREYLASTSGVDRNLGRILATLEDLGIAGNTIVIFSSDHGYNMGHNGIFHKGNGKWVTKTFPKKTETIDPKYRPNMYDNSLKVPLLVKWPGVTRPGMVIDQTVSMLDILPTVAEMAGATIPGDAMVRGRSIVPLLRGKMPAGWNDDYFGVYSMINYCTSYMRCYRTPEWKLIRDFRNPERDELYHLGKDPEERVNLIRSKEVQVIVEKLHRKILAHMETIGDPLIKDMNQ